MSAWTKKREPLQLKHHRRCWEFRYEWLGLGESEKRHVQLVENVRPEKKEKSTTNGIDCGKHRIKPFVPAFFYICSNFFFLSQMTFIVLQIVCCWCRCHFRSTPHRFFGDCQSWHVLTRIYLFLVDCRMRHFSLVYIDIVFVIVIRFIIHDAIFMIF